MYGISKVLLSQNFSFDQHAFHVSVLNGNKAAAKHFYQKLTSEERVISLSRAVDAVLSNEGRNLPRMHSDFPKETLPDVLCYLLSLMSPKQQMQVLKERPPAILRCFAAWPWQDIFVEISKVIMTFIREEMTFLQR
ncbi:hypothetical protein HNY73_007382 [Argiope bruennichi]|uniref:Uncharacterized protein n=2 Tax=Argiope bruennichi TaxID=94029 RepID=A0A8T0FDS6_ARGBR|nr:hypothetical protein HNY73_007382 [Argiope bruennichi]